MILAFGIEIHEEAGLHALAIELSLQLGQPATYDAHYLALALIIGCSLWTGDQRFFKSARKSFPQVHWVGKEHNISSRLIKGPSNDFRSDFSRVESWRRAGAAFELFDARIYLEL